MISPYMNHCYSKMYGPPMDWVGPKPDNSCEVVIKNLPFGFTADLFIRICRRLGRLYSVCILTNSRLETYHVAFVRYATYDDALCAKTVLQDCYILKGRTLEIDLTDTYRHLHIRNIPTYLNEWDVKSVLYIIFPNSLINLRKGFESTNITNNIKNGYHNTILNDNTGEALVTFPSTKEAFQAMGTSLVCWNNLWNCQIKIDWATESVVGDDNVVYDSKSLFIKNVDLTLNSRSLHELLQNYIPAENICRVSKLLSTGFIIFANHKSAVEAKQKLQGVNIRGKRVEVQWTKFSERQLFHMSCSQDFDAALRMKCLANHWRIPIIIFGSYYEIQQRQYCAVMLRTDEGCYSSTVAFICIMHLDFLKDIHSRLCEVVCTILDSIKDFPEHNYLLDVYRDQATILGRFELKNIGSKLDFVATASEKNKYLIDYEEVCDIINAVSLLNTVNEDVLIKEYYSSFNSKIYGSYINNLCLYGMRSFGTIFPSYRNKELLKYNLNNTQIILALCFLRNGTNISTDIRPYKPIPLSIFKYAEQDILGNTIGLIPTSITENNYNQILKYVKFGSKKFYNHDVRMLSPKPYIQGYSYKNHIRGEMAKSLQILIEHNTFDWYYYGPSLFNENSTHLFN
ncbi:uncharacterized protein LOC119666633 [Teleopsis dalmanni]|uniref:uncharacterized protein LOC119666633 n=1 Tax=Teleopsis dalmanni TaxID=139649 RepID=UPI0018CCA53E|nr:uncharacterized protein LOC119666633 [Teleopsis dalmanni]